jgi:hypothetical protein
MTFLYREAGASASLDSVPGAVKAARAMAGPKKIAAKRRRHQDGTT